MPPPLNPPSTEAELDALLSAPDPATIRLMDRIDGDVMILGAGGKMGPTLALLAVNAIRAAGAKRRVIAVSRFSDAAQRAKLESGGVETVACDLLDPDAVNALPKAPNVVFMAGRKFGDKGSEPATWMNNVIVPGNVARAFPASRIVVFSTGCVYPLVAPSTGGSRETDPPAPIGEYANSCLGRERIFEFASEKQKTRVLLYRLNYAVDLRYGVLHDIARRVHDRKPVDLGVNAVNFIWQGDANNRALLCLDQAVSPAAVLNITGPETIDVKTLAERFAARFGVDVRFTGENPHTRAYLSNASRSVELFGAPRVAADTLIEWQADWIARGGPSLGKPTHFQVTDGQFLD